MQIFNTKEGTRPGQQATEIMGIREKTQKWLDAIAMNERNKIEIIAEGMAMLDETIKTVWLREKEKAIIRGKFDIRLPFVAQVDESHPAVPQVVKWILSSGDSIRPFSPPSRRRYEIQIHYPYYPMKLRFERDTGETLELLRGVTSTEGDETRPAPDFQVFPHSKIPDTLRVDKTYLFSEIMRSLPLIVSLDYTQE